MAGATNGPRRSSSHGAKAKKRERLRRCEKARREPLGVAINLLLALAVGSLGFCITHVTSKDSHFAAPASYFFLGAMVSFGGTILLCILATFTRLRDFRLTAKKLRAELHNEDKEKIKKFKDGAARMGRWTWRLFLLPAPAFRDWRCCAEYRALAVILCSLVSKVVAPNALIQPERPVRFAADYSQNLELLPIGLR